MTEGLYSCEFQGRDAGGTAALVFEGNRISGSDGAITYLGTYAESTELGVVDVNVVLSVPAGVPLVTGAPQRDEAYTFCVACKVAARGTTHLKVEVPGGTIDATVRFIRDIPRAPRRARPENINAPQLR